jgi:hypothetical protein
MLSCRTPILRFTRVVALLAVCATLALSGCETVEHKPLVPPSPLPHIAEIMTALRDRGGHLASVHVMRSFVDATVVRDDGQIESLLVWPTMDEPDLRTTSYREATAPWALFDPDTIATQVTQLAKSCPDHFNVTVKAVSSQSVLASVYCGGAGVTQDTADALLNGQHLPAVSTMSALDWQSLLDEWRTVAGPTLVRHISIFDGKVRLYLASEAGVGCGTSFVRSFDGWSSIEAYCLTDRGTMSFTLDGLTGTALADATARALAQHKLTAYSGTSYDLEQNFNEELTMKISQGGVYPKAEVLR